MSDGVKTFLDRFFLRKGSVGETLPDFIESAEETAEFQKIKKYLCEIAEDYDEADNANTNTFDISGYDCD